MAGRNVAHARGPADNCRRRPARRARCGSDIAMLRSASCVSSPAFLDHVPAQQPTQHSLLEHCTSWLRPPSSQAVRWCAAGTPSSTAHRACFLGPAIGHAAGPRQPAPCTPHVPAAGFQRGGRETIDGRAEAGPHAVPAKPAPPPLLTTGIPRLQPHLLSVGASRRCKGSYNTISNCRAGRRRSSQRTGVQRRPPAARERRANLEPPMRGGSIRGGRRSSAARCRPRLGSQSRPIRGPLLGQRGALDDVHKLGLQRGAADLLRGRGETSGHRGGAISPRAGIRGAARRQPRSRALQAAGERSSEVCVVHK